MNPNEPKFFFSQSIGDKRNNKLVTIGNNWNKSVYFVPNKEINNCNQKTNNAKFIKCKGATNKLSTRPGDNIRKTINTIMNA